MAVYQVQSNGQAPPGLSPGDYVNTGGGLYMVAAPGTYGANYNPSSGYWSIKADPANVSYQMQSMINSAQQQAAANNAQSQANAREQMAFQERSLNQAAAFNAQSAKEAMLFSSEEARKNREWQERLSSSAHQREVADLLAAGLNPILSAGGSGASTPSGSAAAGVSASVAGAPGAQGSVDTSVTGAIGSLLATLFSSQVSLDISKLQTAATMYAADRGLLGSQAVAGGTMAAAATSAAASRYNTERQLAYNRWQQENYPGTIPAAVSNIVNGVESALSGSSSSSATYRLIDTLANKMVNLYESVSSKTSPNKGWMLNGRSLGSNSRSSKGGQG